MLICGHSPSERPARRLCASVRSGTAEASGRRRQHACRRPVAHRSFLAAVPRSRAPDHLPGAGSHAAAHRADPSALAASRQQLSHNPMAPLAMSIASRALPFKAAGQPGTAQSLQAASRPAAVLRTSVQVTQAGRNALAAAAWRWALRPRPLPPLPRHSCLPPSCLQAMRRSGAPFRAAAAAGDEGRLAGAPAGWELANRVSSDALAMLGDGDAATAELILKKGAVGWVSLLQSQGSHVRCKTCEHCASSASSSPGLLA